MLETFNRHWPEYMMEAAGLGLFMLSASLFGVLLEHPLSPSRHLIDSALARRACMGLAMGTTAFAIIHSPWGRQSGAHINPATTLTFLRLGKIAPPDAAFYVAFQFLGGVAGISLGALILGRMLAAPGVGYVATLPGRQGSLAAFAAEVAISFGLMLTILLVSNHAGLARHTGLFAGLLVAVYIAFEAPLSGMSMNPARSFASAVWAGNWRVYWIYLTAPLLGMLLAAQVYTGARSHAAVRCAKLEHDDSRSCIFCGHPGTATP